MTVSDGRPGCVAGSASNEGCSGDGEPCTVGTAAVDGDVMRSHESAVWGAARAGCIITWPATYGSEPNDNGELGTNCGEYFGDSCAKANCGGVMRPADDGSDVSECAGDGVGGTSTRFDGGVGGTSKCTRLVVPGMMKCVTGEFR